MDTKVFFKEFAALSTFFAAGYVWMVII